MARFGTFWDLLYLGPTVSGAFWGLLDAHLDGVDVHLALVGEVHEHVLRLHGLGAPLLTSENQPDPPAERARRAHGMKKGDASEHSRRGRQQQQQQQQRERERQRSRQWVSNGRSGTALNQASPSSRPPPPGRD